MTKAELYLYASGVDKSGQVSTVDLYQTAAGASWGQSCLTWSCRIDSTGNPIASSDITSTGSL
jgi:hypothetical protein